MKYLFLIFQDDEQEAKLSEAARDALRQASLANEQDLRQSGQLFAAEDLTDGRAAVLVHTRQGRITVASGLESAERSPIARLYILTARDLNEAIQIAAKMPQVQLGPIEVRPIISCENP